MKIAIGIITVLLALIIIVLVIALFVSPHYEVQRSVVVNAPTPLVFDYVKHIKNQEQFSKWAMVDPNAKITTTGTDGTVGFVYAWDGNSEAGEGEQEIKGIAEDQRLDLELRFIRPFKGLGHAYFITEAENETQTKVTWGMKSKMNYPMNAMLLFMSIDKMLGNDLQTGLDRLKSNLEK